MIKLKNIISENIRKIMKKNTLAENMRRFNTKNLKEYEKKHGPNQNPDRHKVNIDDIDAHSLEFEDIDTQDYPDFVDSYISYAEFEDGTPLNDEQMDWVMDNAGDWVYDQLQNYLH